MLDLLAIDQAHMEAGTSADPGAVAGLLLLAAVVAVVGATFWMACWWVDRRHPQDPELAAWAALRRTNGDAP